VVCRSYLSVPVQRLIYVTPDFASRLALNVSHAVICSSCLLSVKYVHCVDVLVSISVTSTQLNSSLFKSCSRKAKKRYNAVHGRAVLDRDHDRDLS